MKIIELSNVWEKYRIKFIRDKKVSWEEIWALRDVSFEVNQGEVLGLIGENGAGKTTLLKLIAGMLVSDRGKVDVQGKVSVLMELGAGFNPEFTGRENIALNSRLYGLSPERIEEQIQKIIEFSDIGKFIDAPIKYYSQGMYMRLAFALAIFVEPDVLLIDDILSVGDQDAQNKCIKKIFELKKEGKTIILVSHDMSMVRMLCSQVMLLDKGRVVEKGEVQNVIYRYLQTVGDKRGIAVLGKEKLRVVFNNGRITFSYQGLPFTLAMGGYVSYLVAAINSWLSSFNLSWSIISSSLDEFVAEGKSQAAALSQIWAFKLSKDQIHWKIEMKDKAIKDPNLVLFFSPQYKRWLTLGKEGDFPPFVSKSAWQSLDLTDYPQGLVGLAAASETKGLPHLVFQADKNNDQLRLYNTGYEQEGRIIQVNLSSGKDNRFFLKIFLEKNKLADYLKESKQKLVQEQKKEQLKAYDLSAITSNNFSFFADQEKKSLRIYSEGREITKGAGLYSELYISGKWFHSYNAQWEIKKISQQELTVILRYDALPIFQIFSFSYKENSCLLEVKMEIEASSQIRMLGHHLKLEIQNLYSSWDTGYEQGDFSFSQYVNKISPVRLRDNRISNILLIPSPKSVIPKLLFTTFQQTSRRLINIYKQKDEDQEYIVFNSPTIVLKDEELINPGRYTYFEGRITLGKDVKLKNDDSLVKVTELKKDCLRFIFDRGRGRIFWKQKELTFGLGVYTSLCSRGIWYDSYQAVWEIDCQDDCRIIAKGYWPAYLPVSQEWYIELINENIISWQVNMEIHDQTEIEIEQANIMFSSDYKNWIAGDSQQGEFVEEYTSNYNISPFRFWSGKKKEIAASAGSLPVIRFKNDGTSEEMLAIIENSDDLYKARLLQYQRANKARALAEKHLYFKGKIEVGLKE